MQWRGAALGVKARMRRPVSGLRPPRPILGRLLQLGYGAHVQQSRGDGADGDLGDHRDPADEQLVQTEIAQVMRPTGAALVVTVAGEIDFYTMDKFCTALATGSDQFHRGEILVIDLTKVTFISSTGLQALVDIALAAQGQCGPLRLVVDHTRPVIHPLKITGLDELFALFDTVNDALQ